jgi:hypothetical protein
MALQAMWVHGHSANIELRGVPRQDPIDNVGYDVINVGSNRGIKWSFLQGSRVGWGVEYSAALIGASYWFHFSIPTPVIDDGVRSRFRRATVLFTADPGVTLTSFHVWDGPNRVAQHDGLTTGGSNVSLINERNSFALPDRDVFWGAGISVKFFFLAAGGIVTLHAAGIDFES